MQYSALITVMLAAVRKASRRMLRDFHELRFLQSSKKSLDKFLEVTVSNAERTIFDILRKARPEFGIISKYLDYDVDTNAEHSNYWVINVLDGIENFSRAIPYFAISISVMEKENKETNEKIIAGIIYLPALGELYLAEEGKGAWNEFSGEFQAGFAKSRLRVSSRNPIQPMIFTNNSKVNDAKSSIRMFGSHSIALAYLAAGKADKCVLIYNDLSDIAAGIIIAKEAGAVIKNDTQLKKLIVEPS